MLFRSNYNGDNSDTEREALLSEIPKLLAHPNAPQLIHYGNLGTLTKA